MRRVAGMLAVLVAACDRDEAPQDGGSRTATLELAFLPSGENGGGGVELEAATARFDEILLVSDSGEDLMTAAEIDLLAAETVLTLIDARPGLYSRVRLKLGPDDSETLRVDGRFGAVAVELRAREDDEIDLRCPSGERLDPGGRLRLDLDVDRQRWFAGVDLNSAEIDEGLILLDPHDGENSELAEAVLENVLGSFAIGETSSGEGPEGQDGRDGTDEDDGGPEDGAGGPVDGGAAEDDGGEDDGGGGGPDDGGAD